MNSNNKLAQQIADKVARVKVEDDRIGGLYDYALKGAQAGLDARPSISYEEAQELHGLIGSTLQYLRVDLGMTEQPEVRDMVRALEIAAVIVSDTDPERDES